MRQRCGNPNHRYFARYGGRGIVICERWQTFENFFSDMGLRPHGCSLDRINNNGNYEPGNCRWADHVTQARNRSGSKMVVFRGEERDFQGLCALLGVPYRRIFQRMYRGATIEAALALEENLSCLS